MNILEITVLSAEGLYNSNSIFSSHIRPFFVLTKLPASDPHKPALVYKSKVHDSQTFNPIWDEKFRLPVDSTFFSDRYSSLHLQLYTKRRILGPAKLGWCLIPATDIGLLPPGSVRYLSYRLLARDGTRGCGIINLSIKMEGSVPWMSTSGSTKESTCKTVIGIPVTAIRDCSSMR